MPALPIAEATSSHALRELAMGSSLGTVFVMESANG